jgi:NAD(P)H-nitrite reductase large subunit
VNYDKLLLATGGNSRTTVDAGIKGGDLGNIHVIRNASD